LNTCPGTPYDQAPCNTQDCTFPNDIDYWRHNVDQWPDDTPDNTFPACTSLTWLEIVRKTGRLTKWEQLAAEFVAAQLNIQSGVFPTPITNAALNIAETILFSCSSSPELNQVLDALCSFNHGADDYVYSSVEDPDAEDYVTEAKEGGILKGTTLYAVAYGVPAFLVVVIVVVLMTVMVRRQCRRVDSPVVEQQIV